MKQKNIQLQPSKFALTTTVIIATTAFFATILALINPNIKTITPLLQILYKSFGYDISPLGSLIGGLYVAIDTFILTWLFVWLYNKLL